jgi:hypothetical protein
MEFLNSQFEIKNKILVWDNKSVKITSWTVAVLRKIIVPLLLAMIK